MTHTQINSAVRTLIATSALSLVLTSGAYAANSSSIANTPPNSITQNGDQNSVTGSVAAGNSVNVTQNIWGNTANFNVTGTGNTTTLVENGGNNKALITQSNTNNKANLIVDGESNTSTVSSTGSNNSVYSNLRGLASTFTATQSGNGNTIGNPTKTPVAVPVSLGFDNNTIITQSSNNNTVSDASMTGAHQTIRITQQGGDGNAASAIVTGEVNSITFTQTGAGNIANGTNSGQQNTVNIAQAGNNNTYNGNILGAFNTIGGTQNGTGNKLTTNIDGDFSLIGGGVFATLTQSGAGGANTAGTNNDATLNIKAGRSQISLVQAGNSNNAMINNKGNNNFINAVQKADNNKVTANITDGQWSDVQLLQDSTGAAAGTGNTATANIGKDSYGSYIKIDQKGANTASVDIADVAQNNAVDIMQTYASGTPAISGNSATVNIQRANIRNTVKLAQTGSANVIGVDLKPAGYQNVVDTIQTGIGNRSTISVQGAQELAQVRQNGNSNTATVTLAGVGEKAFVTQNGNNMSAYVTNAGNF